MYNVLELLLGHWVFLKILILTNSYGKSPQLFPLRLYNFRISHSINGALLNHNNSFVL